jgi:GDP-4-dehydro-6-deoxy-D-mannose reductase
MVKIGNNTNPVALVTGIAGFCGSHLAELLLENGQAVVGIEREDAKLGNFGAVLGRVELHRVDVRSPDQVRRVLVKVRPSEIYHLAALTKMPANGSYQAVHEVNVLGTINLLETICSIGLECSVLIAGSSAEYGLVRPDENPVRESQPFRPITHYAVSKVAQDLIGYQYWAAAGLQIMRSRAFNIFGPRQSPDLVGSAFAQQVAEIEAGRKEPVIEVGNLEAQRDFVDVRDVVRAYHLIAVQGEPGAVYNVCSGQAHSIRSLLEGLVGLSSVQGIEIRQDPARIQKADVPIQVGDYGKLHRQTGWQPEIPFNRSLRDLLTYWRGRIVEEST